MSERHRPRRYMIEGYRRRLSEINLTLPEMPTRRQQASTAKPSGAVLAKPSTPVATGPKAKVSPLPATEDVDSRDVKLGTIAAVTGAGVGALITYAIK